MLLLLQHADRADADAIHLRLPVLLLLSAVLTAVCAAVATAVGAATAADTAIDANTAASNVSAASTVIAVLLLGKRCVLYNMFAQKCTLMTNEYYVCVPVRGR